MRLGVLETGVPPAALRARFGDYPAMLAALLGEGFQTRTYRAIAGDLPTARHGCDALVITGSPAGVYEDLPWIGPLINLLRAERGRTPLVGICFGHQLMAQAFGGQVTRSPKGWGVGLHHYRVARREPWMDEAAEIRLPASHQDQVITPPPGAAVTLSSAFTPYAGLAYDDGAAVSFQGHPEFAPDFAVALIEGRRGTRYTDAEADAAIASLAEPDDRGRVAGWIRGFLRGDAARRAEIGDGERAVA